MADAGESSDGLELLYGQMTSVELAMKALAAEGVDTNRLHARDLYERSLDCQNLGAYMMLGVAADAVAEHAALLPEDRVLDVGCGVGGPGRFLADRFGCSVLGVDVLPLRVEAAELLTQRTGLDQRVTYRVASATDLPVEDAVMAQVWMLDVGIHVADKAALFGEVARVLRPGGLLVMHDQPGPLPPVMDPVMLGAPFIAPTLTQLIDHIEAAGLRLARWQDTTHHVVAYFRDSQERLRTSRGVVGSESVRQRRQWINDTIDAYLTTLVDLGGRTGLFIAERRTS